MRLLVVGASGAVGSSLAHQAIERGHEVRAYVRNPDNSRGDDSLAIYAVDGIVTFRIDATSGTLTKLSTTPTSGAPARVGVITQPGPG